jgi:cytochrome oxidase assembly protein ShyY1
MSAPNEQRASGAAVFISFGAIFAMLIGLVAWQPRAATWIAEAVDAESSNAPDEAVPVRLAAEPTRRPIDPAAWTQVISSRK